MKPPSSTLFVSARRREGYRFLYCQKRAAWPCSHTHGSAFPSFWNSSLFCPLRSSARNFVSSVRQVVINSSRTLRTRSPSIQYTTIKNQRHTQARLIVSGAKFHAMQFGHRRHERKTKPCSRRSDTAFHPVKPA